MDFPLLREHTLLLEHLNFLSTCEKNFMTYNICHVLHVHIITFLLQNNENVLIWTCNLCVYSKTKTSRYILIARTSKASIQTLTISSDFVHLLRMRLLLLGVFMRNGIFDLNYDRNKSIINSTSWR